jgi:DNA-binding transcriptional LysR family regulator
MDINFEQYKVFYIVARSGSFSSAARALYISQSAVSQSIKSLEVKTRCTLFIRGPKKIKLTDAGEMLFSHVEQAYSLLKSAENKMLEMQSLTLGEIRIGVGDTILRYLLTPFLQQFIKAYPKIKIQVTNRTSPGIIDSLRRGTVDFGIVTMPVDENDIETFEFREVEDVFVASASFDEFKEKLISLKELLSLPLLLLQKESSTRRNLDEYFRAGGIDIIPEIELESMDLLVEFARIGLGIAHVLKESSNTLVKSGELFELKLANPIPRRILGIAKLRNVPLSASAREFVSKLRSVPHLNPSE